MTWKKQLLDAPRVDLSAQTALLRLFRYTKEATCHGKTIAKRFSTVLIGIWVVLLIQRS